MKRGNILSTLALAVLGAMLSVVLSVTSAVALTAAATTAVNVRAGPGTTFIVVDTLFAGEVVEVGQCKANGWCFVKHSGPNGWVYSTYLKQGPGAANPNCAFTIIIGPSGPYLGVTCGGGGGGGVVPVPPAGMAQACFYTGPNYTGARFCRGPGVKNFLNATFNNRITSVRLQGGLRVRLCNLPNMGGFCRNIVNSRAALGPAINNKASSLRVFGGGAPIPAPVPVPPPVSIHSQGTLNLPKTFTANIDNGVISGAGADIWYEVATPAQRYLKPIGGARIWRGAGNKRNRAQCAAGGPYKTAKIPSWNLPPGTYVCVRTNAGRFGRIRINSGFGPKLSFNYRTWN